MLNHLPEPHISTSVLKALAGKLEHSPSILLVASKLSLISRDTLYSLCSLQIVIERLIDLVQVTPYFKESKKLDLFYLIVNGNQNQL